MTHDEILAELQFLLTEYRAAADVFTRLHARLLEDAAVAEQHAKDAARLTRKCEQILKALEDEHDGADWWKGSDDAQ